MIDPAALAKKFEELYGAKPRVFRAPGRVNLIGEHTDYNDGFVMPAAIGFFTKVAVAPRADRKLVLRSEQFGESVELELGALAGPPRKHWSDFVRGVAVGLLARGGEQCGANLLISGDVPLGAGLSSSAALEVSAALALAAVWNLRISKMDTARLCQKAEHEFAGTKCGIMDQFISLHAQKGTALKLDCRSLESEALPIPRGVRVLICDSRVKHSLASGEYNRRRQECEAGVAALARHESKVKALRDATLPMLEACRAEVSDVVFRRSRHVITENARVVATAAAFASEDLVRAGELMYSSHASLREDYEVSCPELDALVEIARSIHGVYGARMTGGGFGGCTVNLVAAEAVPEFKTHLEAEYERQIGKTPAIYDCESVDGAKEVTA